MIHFPTAARTSASLSRVSPGTRSRHRLPSSNGTTAPQPLFPACCSFALNPPSATRALRNVYMLLSPSLITFCLGFAAQTSGHPVDWFRKFSVPSKQDGGWLWGWAWATDGSVSVVDRSPPLVYSARPASFGVELADPLLGYVIPLSAFTAPCPADNNTTHYPFIPDPDQGCPDLCVSGPSQPDPAETWIALVQRGGCPFVDKARQAQRLGAKAVVVGGDRDNPDALLNMYSESESSPPPLSRVSADSRSQKTLLMCRSRRRSSSTGTILSSRT